MIAYQLMKRYVAIFATSNHYTVAVTYFFMYRNSLCEVIVLVLPLRDLPLFVQFKKHEKHP